MLLLLVFAALAQEPVDAPPAMPEIGHAIPEEAQLLIDWWVWLLIGGGSTAVAGGGGLAVLRKRLLGTPEPDPGMYIRDERTDAMVPIMRVLLVEAREHHTELISGLRDMTAAIEANTEAAKARNASD